MSGENLSGKKTHVDVPTDKDTNDTMSRPSARKNVRDEKNIARVVSQHSLDVLARECTDIVDPERTDTHDTMS